jgi:hypothetical protein
MAICKFLDPRCVQKILSLVLNSFKNFGNPIKFTKKWFGKDQLVK